MSQTPKVFTGLENEFLHYYTNLLGEMIVNLCTPERDDIEKLLKMDPFSNQFLLQNNDLKRWERLFQHQPKYLSYTYSSPVSTQQFLQLINSSGFKLYNIYETFCEARFHSTQPMLENEVYQSDTTLAGVEKVAMKRENLIMAKFTTTDKCNASPVMEIEDTFLIAVNKDTSNLPKRTKNSKDVNAKNLDYEHSIPLSIAPDLAWEFGKVSGDINLVHATRLGKVFGFERPFLQARCALNLVIANTDKLLNRALKSINIKMLKRIHTGLSYTLEVGSQGFRIRNETEVLAQGSIALA